MSAGFTHFEPATSDHGQRRVLREHFGLCLSAPTAEKPAAAGAHDDLHMAASATQALRIGRLALLARLVHDERMFTSEAVTRNIRVSVVAEYSAERSQPQQHQWFFLYTIRITNEGQETVQLLSRHWIITNAEGLVEEVRGAGVVGEQPVLAPGESFTYTSGCPLRTAFGTMEGTYQMITRDGERFDARIAAFTLSEPYTVH
jgi:ApaG protein